MPNLQFLLQFNIIISINEDINIDKIEKLRELVNHLNYIFKTAIVKESWEFK